MGAQRGAATARVVATPQAHTAPLGQHPADVSTQLPVNAGTTQLKQQLAMAAPQTQQRRNPSQPATVGDGCGQSATSIVASSGHVQQGPQRQMERPRHQQQYQQKQQQRQQKAAVPVDPAAVDAVFRALSGLTKPQGKPASDAASQQNPNRRTRRSAQQQQGQQQEPSGRRQQPLNGTATGAAAGAGSAEAEMQALRAALEEREAALAETSMALLSLQNDAASMAQQLESTKRQKQQLEVALLRGDALSGGASYASGCNEEDDYRA